MNKHIPAYNDGVSNAVRAGLVEEFEAHLSVGRPYALPKDVFDLYETSFAEGNEWVRKRFFPNRKRLFPAKTHSRKTICELDEESIEQIASLLACFWLKKEASLVGNTRGVPSKIRRAFEQFSNWMRMKI